MIHIFGKYSDAVIMCPQDEVEDYALSQIQMIADNEAAKGSKIVVMPDVHPGKVGPIGLTMTVKDVVIPALIGIDIGCGMSLARIGKVRKDFQKLDSLIRDSIPVGSMIHGDFRGKSKYSGMSKKTGKPNDTGKSNDTGKPDDTGKSDNTGRTKKADKAVNHGAAGKSSTYKDPIVTELSSAFDPGFLRCAAHIRQDKVMQSLGTLGGGNHFIEVDEDEDGENYLIIHSGSRRLGKEVAEYYMDKGHKSLKKQGINVPYEMTYLTGELLEDYLHDIILVQEYAMLNRKIMIRTICKGMKWKIPEEISCIHNYVELQQATAILRKGAISAKKGEDVIIPINMRDGVILGKGKGNSEWNYSAPHGAGRIASREKTANTHTLSEFKKAMKGIYSGCISKDTLDEAPFAYRDINYITAAIKDAVEITKILKPVYSYKGGHR